MYLFLILGRPLVCFVRHNKIWFYYNDIITISMMLRDIKVATSQAQKERQTLLV